MYYTFLGVYLCLSGECLNFLISRQNFRRIGNSVKRTRRVRKERDSKDKAIKNKTKKNTRSKTSGRTYRKKEKAAETAATICPLLKKGGCGRKGCKNEKFHYSYKQPKITESEICPKFKTGTCPFGRTGKNKGGCKFPHNKTFKTKTHPVLLYSFNTQSSG